MGALSHFGKRAAGSPDAVVGLSRLGNCVLQEKTTTPTQFRGEVRSTVYGVHFALELKHPSRP